MTTQSNNETELGKKVDILKKEVDALQIKILAESRAWYKQASTMIALFALVFSFGTTVISYQRTIEQDQRSLKQELRGLILQLVQLPIKNIETNQKFTGNEILLGDISAFFNQEGSMLANQSFVIAEKIPDLVTAAEYLTMSIAFHNAGQMERAEEMRKKAILVSKNPIETITSLRQLGAMKFQQGNFRMGREYFREALTKFNNTKVKPDPFVVAFTNATTEMFWAQSESINNQCHEFNIHIAEAIKLATQTSPGTKNQILSRINGTKSLGCPPESKPSVQ
jgi:tetratricopeptide (TPR) repeat protein